MERKIYLVLLLISLMETIGAVGTSDETFYKAYINNDRLLWKSALDQLQKQHEQTAAAKMRLLDYQYGYIGWCLQEKNSKEALQYLELAQNGISKLEKDTVEPVYINTYKSVLDGFRIRISPWKAPAYGPRSLSSIKKAIEKGKDNPFVYVQYGNIRYYAPVAFGGSKTEALNYYLKSKELMEKDQAANRRNWKYLNLLRTIAQTYVDLGDKNSAIQYCKKILNIEPGFIWVKEEFYPGLLKKAS